MDRPLPPTRVQASIEIAAPPREVWRYLGDFEDPEIWAAALSYARRTTGDEVGVGSRREVRYRHLLRMEQVITQWDEGRRLQYAVFKAPWPLRHFFETWEVTPSITGARVRSAVAYELWFGAVGRFVNWIFTRHVLLFEMRTGLNGLKRAAENDKLVRPPNDT